jgi:multidrug efflux pump subunit AcrA (membrane-fusion protein)
MRRRARNSRRSTSSGRGRSSIAATSRKPSSIARWRPTLSRRRPSTAPKRPSAARPCRHRSTASSASARSRRASSSIPTHTITRIESLSRLVVDVAFAESDLGRLATGQAAEVTAEALPAETFRGSVSYVATRVREDTRTVDVRVAIVDPSMRLRPGLTALARIVTSHVDDSILVPSQAIVRSDAGPAVYVAAQTDGKSTAELRPIKTGERTSADVEVVSGLAVGDRVIIEGLARLKPGAPVAVEAPAESAGATAERSP